MDAETIVVGEALVQAKISARMVAAGVNVLTFAQRRRVQGRAKASSRIGGANGPSIAGDDTKMGVNQVIAVVDPVGVRCHASFGSKRQIRDLVEGSAHGLHRYCPPLAATALKPETLARLAGFEPPSGLQSPNGIFLREFHLAKLFVAILPEPDDGLLAKSFLELT